MKFLIRVISLILVGALAITTLPANTIAANPVDPIETQWVDVGGGMDKRAVLEI